MLRKQIIRAPALESSPTTDEIDIAAVATVLVTSESADHPVDHAFDRHRGPGGSRWMAGEPGEQTLILAFDAPQSIRRVSLDVEETGMARTQELQLAVSDDGGHCYREMVRQEYNFSPPHCYREMVRQEYNFSPPGTTFEREDWSVPAGGVTHLRLQIKPDKGGKFGLASITSLVLR